MNNYYIYCISPILSKDQIDIKGFDNKTVSVHKHYDICALVSETNNTLYKPNLTNLQYHNDVISKAMEFNTILPLSFSSIISKENVDKFLDKYYCQFKNNLDKVKGKVELGVKIFYKFDSTKHSIESKNPREFMLSKYNIYKQDKTKIDLLKKELKLINEELLKYSISNKYSMPFKNNLIFNASYLVNNKDVNNFSSSIEIIKEKYKNYKIRFSGPWAPYNFVNLEEEKT